MTLNIVYKFKVNPILTLASRASTRFFEVIKGQNSGSNYRKSLKINRLLLLMTSNTVYKFKVNWILTLAFRASTRVFEVIKGNNSGSNYRKSLKIKTLNTVYKFKVNEILTLASRASTSNCGRRMDRRTGATTIYDHISKWAYKKLSAMISAP